MDSQAKLITGCIGVAPNTQVMLVRNKNGNIQGEVT